MSERIPKQVCPFCRYAMDHADGLETKKPKVGDISLCLKCMEISLFGKGFMLREPTVTELIEIQRSLAWLKIERARAAWRRLKIKEQITAEGR
jgi:hypothetical protein